MRSSPARILSALASAELPLHELAECAVWVITQLCKGALLGNFSIVADDDNSVTALDRTEPMCDADRRVVATQQLRQSLVDERLGLGVKCRRGLIEDKNVRILQQGPSNGNALLLATRELSAPCSDVSFESIGLYSY